ncbi:MAG: hypothetical protein QOG92_1882 [Verrucomicrobiota bacterium]|jgi:hypothetical protein|nr:hypothetical protein [Verrucomicrobiota bacterium]MEA3206187.1 hypothetical protein [Verrucomicrobiota bacterium]
MSVVGRQEGPRGAALPEHLDIDPSGRLNDSDDLLG